MPWEAFKSSDCNGTFNASGSQFRDIGRVMSPKRLPGTGTKGLRELCAFVQYMELLKAKSIKGGDK